CCTPIGKVGEALIELDPIKFSLQVNLSGADQRDLTAHALRRVDAASLPVRLDLFPSGISETRKDVVGYVDFRNCPVEIAENPHAGSCCYWTWRPLRPRS